MSAHCERDIVYMVTKGSLDGLVRSKRRALILTER
jgi:hypothetical protein